MAFSKNRRLAQIISDTSGNLAVQGLTVPTQSASDNDTSAASTAYVTTAVSGLIDSAPDTLNTLNEIAAALNDDANFNTTVTNSIAAKLPLAGGTLTGDLTITNATPTITFSDSDVNYEATIQGLSGSLVLKADANDEFGTESIQFHTGGSQRAQFDASGNFGIGTTSPDCILNIVDASSPSVRIKDTSQDCTLQLYAQNNNAHIGTSSNHAFVLDTNNTERVRIDTSGNVLINRTAGGFNNDGTIIGASSGSYMYMERSAGTSNAIVYLHRRNGDGNLMQFYESNSQEGSIEVSGSTILYNGFCGTHDSSGSGVSLSTPVGTVLSTVDEEHKTKHAKVKVSDTASDKRVYGVLQTYKAEETDDTKNTKAAHAVVAAVGIASVRVTGACAGGDLLESAGDGTAKVQSDDVIRSSTLGKVTIGNSNEEEKLVSCVMYCG